MIVSRVSELTGNLNTMDIPVSDEALKLWESYSRPDRPLIQDYFPALNDDEREFIMTGITPQEWDDMCNSLDKLTF